MLQTTWINVKNGGYDPHDEGMVFCGFPSIWCNPFRNRKDLTRNQKIEAFSGYLLSRSDLLRRLPELKGKTLVCYCYPLACHCEVLAHLADSGWWEDAA